MTPLIRAAAASLVIVAVAACSGATAPTPAAPTSDVNPITGSRGGSGAK